MVVKKGQPPKNPGGNIKTGVGGNCVRRRGPGKSVRGGTHFPRKFCPARQDILSTLGQIVRVWFLTNSIIKGTDDGLYYIIATSYSNTYITIAFPQFLSRDE